MSLVFKKIILTKGVYCSFCQLALLNISLSVETASVQKFSMQVAFFSSLIANMVTILINFQQKFTLVRSFQHFAIKFLNQHVLISLKRFLARLKSASRSSLSWRGKCEVFLLELLSAIAQSKLARKNDATDFARSSLHTRAKMTSYV